MEVLQQHKLSVNKSSYRFGQSQVDYLRHLVSKDEVSINPTKIAIVLTWSTPITLKSLQGFLGLTGYHRKFVLDYEKMSQHLTMLLQKDQFQWTIEVEMAFNFMKQAMIYISIFTLPNFSKEFTIEFDALVVRLGIILRQEGCSIVVSSQASSLKSLGLSTYGKEFVVIVFIIHKWHSYVAWHHFKIPINHLSLKYMMEQRISTPRMGYDFEVVYCNGKENKAIDTLSCILKNSKNSSNFLGA